MHAAIVELIRGKDVVGRYALHDCSWYVGTPRDDTGVVQAWALVVPCPRTIIIEFPERAGWLLRRCSERAAVGWSPGTFQEWQRFLSEAGVPEGDGLSADPQADWNS